MFALTPEENRLDVLMKLMAAGISTRAELAWWTCQMLGLKHPSGTVARTIRLAQRKEYVESASVGMFAHGTVQLMRLTVAGFRYCINRGMIVNECEWVTMIRKHQGDIQPRHTAMVLMFAYQARKRGYQVKVMPRTYVQGWIPDAAVVKGYERYYIEVETRARLERVEAGKWEKALSGAQELGAGLGIVALMPYARRKLMEWAPGAWVTDLSSLCQGQEKLWFSPVIK